MSSCSGCWAAFTKKKGRPETHRAAQAVDTKAEQPVEHASHASSAPAQRGEAACSTLRVVRSDDLMGASTMAVRALEKDTVLLREPPLLLVYPSRDPPWLAAMRAELVAMAPDCAWQYCMAAHGLSEEELPQPAPPGLAPLSAERRAGLMQLCGEVAEEGVAPSELAIVTVRHLLIPSGKKAKEEDPMVLALARRVDDVASRVSRNGFQVMDMKARPPTGADAVFHTVSFLNHCCGGLNTASWTFSGEDKMMTVKTACAVEEGEELTISYIAKPWSDMAKPARRRYLKQNYNFICLCKACTRPTAICKPASGGGAEEARVGREGKLGNLLSRWLREDRDEEDEDPEAEPQLAAVPNDAVNAPQDAEAGAPPPVQRSLTASITEGERLERLLKRCERDGLQVTPQEAQEALDGEDGHVGKAVLRLKRRS